MSRKRFYLGLRAETPLREVFASANEPTELSHGQRYNAVVGPFNTKRGAEFMRDYGFANPHCRNVAEAERLARRYR
jgi:hypothetical protein